DRRALRVLRGREEPLLPAREPGAELRTFRPAAPELPFAPRHRQLRPPRHLHGPARGAGRVPAHAAGARTAAADTLTSPEGRLKPAPTKSSRPFVFLRVLRAFVANPFVFFVASVAESSCLRVFVAFVAKPCSPPSCSSCPSWPTPSCP